MRLYSIIVPVYNRPDEIDELLSSLVEQSHTHFETVIIEDGSSRPCNDVVARYHDRLRVKYILKPNTGRSDSRNVGMTHATGHYFVFVDSDCILPPNYFEMLEQALQRTQADCFGGPDRDHPSFTDLQKAINYAMTSFWTTGGIRGGKVQMEKFVPRTFNMGFSRAVYEAVGGFKDMFGEDVDLSTRIRQAGFSTLLFRDVFVYHKRRVSVGKFCKQVYIFGTARINLYKLYPQSLKLVHTLPAAFTVGSVALLGAAWWSLWFLTPFACLILLLFIDSMTRYRRLRIALLAVPTCFLQLYGYGAGFLVSFMKKVVLRRGLEDIETLKRVYR